MALITTIPCAYKTHPALLMIFVIGLLAGCASGTEVAGERESAQYDPWEPTNRKLFALHRTMDKVVAQPLAKGYKKVTPTFARRGISNFFDNLTTPRSAVNNFLQGKPSRGFNEIGRFLFNSVVGIGGLIDIASAGGMERYDEDFSQTLAVWGLPKGPYLVLPLFGPNTVLDGVSLPVDFYSDLLVHFKNTGTRDKLYVLRLIDLRSRLLAVDTLLDNSQDPYITLRESYLQNREYEIYDGDPPIDDDIYEFMDDE